MEVLLVLAALAVLAALVLGVRRRLRVAAWDRELDQAFGTQSREVSLHRSL
ncbi:MAG TPA: hypothetical protein VFZ64_15825 [Nocardioidaceae bacterium]